MWFNIDLGTPNLVHNPILAQTPGWSLKIVTQKILGYLRLGITRMTTFKCKVYAPECFNSLPGLLLGLHLELEAILHRFPSIPEVTP